MSQRSGEYSVLKELAWLVAAVVVVGIFLLIGSGFQAFFSLLGFKF